MTNKIALLNDTFRQTFTGGKVVMTVGINSKSPEEVAVITRSVRTFGDFSEDNDPHHEHDFGAVDFKGERIFWKIDYYDEKMEMGSEDPSDPSKTTRVLTIMLADEY